MSSALAELRTPKNPPPERWIGLSDRLFPPGPSRRTRRRLRAARRFCFVAYAREDAAAVRPIIEAAEAEGFLLWTDWVDLPPGGLWSADIVAAIRAAQAVLVFCSANAFASRDVYREVATASRFNKPILPFFIDAAHAPDEFLYYLSVHQAIRLSEPDWRSRLLCALEAMEQGRKKWRASRIDCPEPLVATRSPAIPR
jgi:hypothetical protein